MPDPNIPECDSDQPEWLPYWLPNAINFTNEYSFDNCHRFGNITIQRRLVESDTCPSTLFDRSILQPCENFTYENTYSVVYDFDLGGNKWARWLIGTIRTLGAFPALPITGYISDRWGRRVAICISVVNGAWIGVVRYWANTYIGFVISEFMESVVAHGCFACSYILMTESVGPKYRVAAGASMNTFFAVGSVLMGLIAWAVLYWRNLTLVLYIPKLLTISYFWLMSESVCWYMSKGRFKESEALLKKAAKVNGRHLSEKCLDALRHNAEEEARRNALEKTN